MSSIGLLIFQVTSFRESKWPRDASLSGTQSAQEFLISVWKYVDDTTASEVVGKGEVSSAQIIDDKVAEWSLANRV